MAVVIVVAAATAAGVVVFVSHKSFVSLSWHVHTHKRSSSRRRRRRRRPRGGGSGGAVVVVAVKPFLSCSLLWGKDSSHFGEQRRHSPLAAS